MIVSHHTIIQQIYVRLSLCPSISTETVRTMPFALGQCVARNPTMCLFFLSLYGCGQVIQLNDFMWCSLAFIANVVVGFPRRCHKKYLPAINHARGLPFNGGRRGKEGREGGDGGGGTANINITSSNVER